jgi:hypothetical protein
VGHQRHIPARARIADLAAPTADFELGQEYELYRDYERKLFAVHDSAGRLVATLPYGYVGEVCTRRDRWLIEVWRRRIGWALVAHEVRSSREAAWVRPGLLPFAYRMEFEFGGGLRVTRSLWDWGCWNVSYGFTRLVRILALADQSRVRGPQDEPLFRIETAEAASRATAPIGLPILLTLQLMKADEFIPRLEGGDAGG